MADFTDFNAWSKAGKDAGYFGPTRTQGHEKFEFTRKDGLIVGAWDAGKGKLGAVVAPSPQPVLGYGVVAQIPGTGETSGSTLHALPTPELGTPIQPLGKSAAAGKPAVVTQVTPGRTSGVAVDPRTVPPSVHPLPPPALGPGVPTTAYPDRGASWPK